RAAIPLLRRHPYLVAQLVGAAVHPDDRRADRLPRLVDRDHAVELRRERDRGDTVEVDVERTKALTERVRPGAGILLRPAGPRVRDVVRLVRGRGALAVRGESREAGALRADVDADNEVAAAHTGAPVSSSSACAAGQRSTMTRCSARVIASGRSCMKMFRPTLQPTAPARIAASCRVNSSSSVMREPPARTTGSPVAASTSCPNSSSLPGQLVLTTSAPSSAQRRTLRRR